MKIVYLLGSLNRGGTETLMHDVFRNAVSCGLDALCIYRKGGVCESDFQSSGVEMQHYPTGKNPIAYIIGLRKRLLQEKAEVVHAMQPLDALYAWLATRWTNIRVVQTLHGFDFEANKTDLMINHFILKRTDRNFFVSYMQRNYYTDRYQLNPFKQEVVYNGISFEKLDQEVIPSSNLKEEFYIPDGVWVLGMVGNFNAVRDQFTVCRFLKLLDAKGIDFRFIFVGKRVTDQEELYDRCVNYCRQQGIDEKVIFTGVRQDVPNILKQLDAFIYSTDHDTFGIAVVEAMASGIPVFVNDWKVMSEITQHGQLATLYKTADPQNLLEKFHAFINQRNLFVEKAELASMEVRKYFSIQSHIRRLLEIYSRLY